MARTPSDVDLALLRLVAHGLVGPSRQDPVGAVRRMLCLQAQEDWSGLASVAVRSTGRTGDAAATMDTAAVVRSWPMRGTLHLLAASDLRWMLALLGPRQVRARAPRRAELGLGPEVLDRAAEVAVEALAGPRPLGRAELVAVWSGAGIDTTDGRDYHLVTTLAQLGVLCYGPARDGRPGIVAVDDWIPPSPARDRAEALAELGRRYFESHGPATPADLARWAGLTAADTRAAVVEARPHLDTMDVDGTEYLLAPGRRDELEAQRRRARGVLVLPGFDELVFGYRDRSPTLPDAIAPKVMTSNGVGRHSVLVDGRVVATWSRPARRGRPPTVTPLVELPAATVALAQGLATSLLES